MSVTVSMTGNQRYYAALKAVALKKKKKPSRIIREAVDAMFGNDINEILASNFFDEDDAQTPHMMQESTTHKSEEAPRE